MSLGAIRSTAAILSSVIVFSASLALGHSSKEESYTITSTMQILQPVRPEDMNDDFQACRLISQDKDSCTLEMTYYPLFQQMVEENPNWRVDDAKMDEYLRPTLTENWDTGMQRDLIAALREDGIDPDQLTDKQLVERVSSWAIRRTHTTEDFAIWMCSFREGKPVILPPLLDTFNAHKPSADWTPQKTFDEELLGKSMFYNQVRGSCTSSSIYICTILRALGIPTRIIFCSPPFDPNDASQARMFYEKVRHNRVRETVRAALDGMHGFDNHMFNEVYVGKHWVRLNYNKLGQPILDRDYFGLLTHIYTTSDMSRVPIAQTWGMRYFHYPAGQPRLSSVNPYRLIAISDHFGAAAKIDNPDVPPAEFRTVTIDKLYPANAPVLPEFLRTAAAQHHIDFYISYKERVDGFHPMRVFYERAGTKFVLAAPGSPRIHATWSGATVSANGFETCAANIDSADKEKLVPGSAYTIEPINVSDMYCWVVAPGVKLTIPKSDAQTAAQP
jgi:hypothetical protein